MQRIKLGKPYDDFIQSQIDAGYYGTATEVIRDSLRAKMTEAEDNRIAFIKSLVDQGLESVKNQPLIEVNDESLEKILSKAKKMAKSGYNVKSYLKP